jgi:hypothetical protein
MSKLKLKTNPFQTNDRKLEQLMNSILMFYQSIEVNLRTGPDICDITPALNQLIRETNIKNGNLAAAMVG